MLELLSPLTSMTEAIITEAVAPEDVGCHSWEEPGNQQRSADSRRRTSRSTLGPCRRRERDGPPMVKWFEKDTV